MSDLTFWIVYVVICIGTVAGNFFYSWLIEKTRIYDPRKDLNRRATETLFKKESADKIAFMVFYLFFYAVIVAPIIEELVFRDWLFSSMLPDLGFWVAALASATCWAILHIAWYAIPYITFTGFILAYVWMTYGLIFCVLLHGINNAVAISVEIYQNLYPSSKEETIIFFK
jgi:membrane protease YdiL (CAAX protease family)